MSLVWPVFGAWDTYSWYDKIYLCVHWHHASDFRLTNLPICLLWWRKLILCLDVWVVYDQRMLLLSRMSLPNLVRLPHCDRLLKSRYSWDRLTKQWSILQSWKMNLILICQPFFGNSLGLVVFYNWGGLNCLIGTFKKPYSFWCCVLRPWLLKIQTLVQALPWWKTIASFCIIQCTVDIVECGFIKLLLIIHYVYIQELFYYY